MCPRMETALKRTISTALAACVVALSLTACGSGSSDSDSGNAADELRLGIALGDLATFDPARVLADAMQLVIPMYAETLVDVDQDDPKTVLPNLATSWEASEDLKTYTFKLRDDVTFPSGNTMTAEDVKFSLERVKNVQGASAFKMGIVDSVNVVDDTTVEFVLTGPDSSFPSRMAAPYLSVFDSKVLQENGAVSDASAVTADDAQAFMDKTTVGTGPYELEEWRRNSEVVFKLRDDYWGEAPAFDTIVLEDIRDASTQAQLVERGDIDIAMDIEPDTAASLEGKDGIKVVTEPSFNINYLAMNHQSKDAPELADDKVRQAIQMAVDYDGISSALADGAPRPAAVVPIGFVGADKVEPIGYDPDAAKKLLDEAGVSGLELDVEFANVTWYGVSQQSLWEKLQSDFDKVGIKVNIRPVEYEKWIEGYRAGEFSITSGLWAPEDFDSSSYFDPFGREAGIYGERTSMDFPIGQKLYDEYLAEKDPAGRETIAEELITAMRDDATLIPLFQANKFLVHSDAVTGVRYSPNKQIRLAEIKPS